MEKRENVKIGSFASDRQNIDHMQTFGRFAISCPYWSASAKSMSEEHSWTLVPARRALSGTSRRLPLHAIAEALQDDVSHWHKKRRLPLLLHMEPVYDRSGQQ